jgi:hypothetical protein
MPSQAVGSRQQKSSERANRAGPSRARPGQGPMMAGAFLEMEVVARDL